MEEKTKFKTIKEFLYQEGKTFVIPNYQRGYKWAVKEDQLSSIEKLCDDLQKAGKQQQYFLQGVTVVEDNNDIILIDGQQRTTSLYFLLWCLGKENIEKINLKYKIRKDSADFINQLKKDDKTFEEITKENNEDNQDVYYFKEALKQVNEQLKKIIAEDTQKKDFLNFLLNKVTILYIIIDKEKATKTFTMMNGQKATMLQEELVKAEMLRRVSIPEKIQKEVSTSVDDNLNDIKEIVTMEWETNALRSRYAREWDKWLYWWNRKEVQEFFGCENPLGYLLEFYLKDKKGTTGKDLFDVFKDSLSENGKTEKQKTKLVFKELRDLQKSFEDIYNIPKIHNYLKMSLICANDKDDRFNIIQHFITQKSDLEVLSNYTKYRLVEATHLEIVNPEKSSSEFTPKERAENMLEKLKGRFVYEEAYELTAKQLLRLNVEEENKLFDGKGRRFDFSIYGNKSLEHIHPKSKVYISDIQEGEQPQFFYGNNEDNAKKKENEMWLDRSFFNQEASEHCIGNLVLLDKNENSNFYDKPFKEKKSIYFNVDECFKSRNLLHSISVFSKSSWGAEEILDNKKKFIERIKKDYEI